MNFFRFQNYVNIKWKSYFFAQIPYSTVVYRCEWRMHWATLCVSFSDKLAGKLIFIRCTPHLRWTKKLNKNMAKYRIKEKEEYIFSRAPKIFRKDIEPNWRERLACRFGCSRRNASISWQLIFAYVAKANKSEAGHNTPLHLLISFGYTDAISDRKVLSFAFRW